MDNAITFIRKCLNKNKDERPTAKDLIDNDDWLKSVNMTLEQDEKRNLIRQITHSVVVDKHSFADYAITSFISNVIMKSQDARQIGTLFMEMDTDGNGTISKAEFAASGDVQACLNANGPEGIDQIFEQIDTNHSGQIEYSEFITAVMDKSVQLSRQNLELAFDALADEDGYITCEQVCVFFNNAGAAQDERGDC